MATAAVYSHEDAAAGCYGPPHPQHYGDVAAQPAEETLGQVLASRHEDEVFIGYRGVVAAWGIVIHTFNEGGAKTIDLYPFSMFAIDVW